MEKKPKSFIVPGTDFLDEKGLMKEAERKEKQREKETSENFHQWISQSLEDDGYQKLIKSTANHIQREKESEVERRIEEEQRKANKEIEARIKKELCVDADSNIDRAWRKIVNSVWESPELQD